MPRVLLVTSAYKPATAADMHRARHLAWELPKLGWNVEVLHPNHEFQRPDSVEMVADWLFCPDTPSHEAALTGAALFRLANMRSIGWRALWPMYRAGLALLGSRRFDVVYITTANFPLFCLGPLWRRRTGVPYVLDYHDPWVRADAGERTTQHSLKRRISNMLAVSMEATAVRNAAGIVSVSPVYLDELKARFGTLPQLSESRTEAMPFAASEHDFAPKTDTTPSDRQARTIVYIGAGGAIMARSFRTICESLARVKTEAPALLEGVRIRLLGTDSGWSEGGPRPLQEIAAQFGLNGLITEEPRRITYSAAMESVRSSDGLLVLGVDDPGYVPSKLFNYALAGSPLLACFRADSPAVAYFSEVPGLGELMTFPADASQPTVDQLGMMKTFLAKVAAGTRIDRRRELEPHLAPAMAQRHASLFARVTSAAAA